MEKAMCFSATASFTLFATLVPAGLYTVTKANHSNRVWLPFAAFPLAFGIQQGFEGFVWLGIQDGNDTMVNVASRGFIFFSHFFWLVWVPFSVWMIELNRARKRAVALVAVIGFVYGLSVFLPSFLIEDWLTVEQANRSLEYKLTLIYDGFFSRTALRFFYAVIVLGALFLSTDRRIKVFGSLVAISLIITYAFYSYAFISVWCFFAAMLSAYLAAIIILDNRQLSELGSHALRKSTEE